MKKQESLIAIKILMKKCGCMNCKKCSEILIDSSLCTHCGFDNHSQDEESTLKDIEHVEGLQNTKDIDQSYDGELKNISETIVVEEEKEVQDTITDKKNQFWEKIKMMNFKSKHFYFFTVYLAGFMIILFTKVTSFSYGNITLARLLFSLIFDTQIAQEYHLTRGVENKIILFSMFIIIIILIVYHFISWKKKNRKNVISLILIILLEINAVIFMRSEIFLVVSVAAIQFPPFFEVVIPTVLPYFAIEQIVCLKMINRDDHEFKEEDYLKLNEDQKKCYQIITTK